MAEKDGAVVTHSPIPWRFNDLASACIVSAVGDHAVCTGHDYDEGGIVAPENAEFICRAVNAHEALVNAAREMVDAHDAEARRLNFERCGCRPCVQFRAALRLAEGK